MCTYFLYSTMLSGYPIVGWDCYGVMLLKTWGMLKTCYIDTFSILIACYIDTNSTFLVLIILLDVRRRHLVEQFDLSRVVLAPLGVKIPENECLWHSLLSACFFLRQNPLHDGSLKAFLIVKILFTCSNSFTHLTSQLE